MMKLARLVKVWQDVGYSRKLARIDGKQRRVNAEEYI